MSSDNCWTLHIDVPMTRRKRWHHVTDPDGVVHFSSHRSSDCFGWIAEKEVAAFLIRGPKIALFVGVMDQSKE